MAGGFFFYQVAGKEDPWRIAMASERERVVRDIKPAFTTVLDLSSVPEDNDWSKVRYSGPLYFDFDAGGDLPFACEQFQIFLGKLHGELGFDINQARLYASGSKGFHVEIPEACFMPKEASKGTPWLPYIYREMAQALVVDSMDMVVYTGKRGRQWRTPNVKRENGKYKVPLTVSDAMTITEEVYQDLVSEPRLQDEPTPPSCNSSFALLFTRAKEKITAHMRTRKKRADKAVQVLEPWKKAKKHPPTIEKLMAGEDLAEGAGFQSIAMQLAIYATAVAMPLPEFLERCRGVIDNHVSDSTRYNTAGKRREELTRMYRYMEENSMYDFEVGPIIKLLRPGTPATDLGVMAEDDPEDRPPANADESPDGVPLESEDGEVVDLHKGVRRGLRMNGNGMWRTIGDGLESVCRGIFRNIESFHDVEGNHEFKGYEADLVVPGRRIARVMVASEYFSQPTKFKAFMVGHQLSFQGGENETSALLDIMAEKAGRAGKVYVYAREGLTLLQHPESDDPDPVKVYLTQDTFASEIAENDPRYFRLRYRTDFAQSSYNIDVHKAPKLNEEHIDGIRDLLNISKPAVVADLVGWFAAAHYRSFYMRLFGQFPLLQVWGEAGGGKSQTTKLLCHLHWYLTDRISIKSASACTPYVLDHHVTTTSSAPLILDEYKPHEMRKFPGKHEKLKDIFKMSYMGGDVGERGNVQKNSEGHITIDKKKASAPIVFIGEAIEAETAIFERCVVVHINKGYHSSARTAAFERVKASPVALSALGRAIVEMSFGIDLEKMREEVAQIQADIKAKLPGDDEAVKRLGDRLIYNRAVVKHGLMTVKRVLQHHLGDVFNDEIEDLMSATSTADDAKVVQHQGMAEIAKVINRLAILSRDEDKPYEMRMGRDYLVGEGWMEIKVDKAYDNYRMYCAAVHESPLFSNSEAFLYAINSFSSTIDKVCATSELRQDGSGEAIVRLDLRKLRREGVQSFRS